MIPPLGKDFVEHLDVAKPRLGDVGIQGPGFLPILDDRERVVLVVVSLHERMRGEIDRHERKMGLPPEGSLHASDFGHVHVLHHTRLSFPLQIDRIAFGKIREFNVLRAKDVGVVAIFKYEINFIFVSHL